jgi:hypothetical protein
VERGGHEACRQGAQSPRISIRLDRDAKVEAERLAGS